MNAPVKEERDLRRIIVLGTALGFGFLFASLESLGPSPNPTGFTYRFTFRTLIAFSIGAAAVLPFWWIFFRSTSKRKVRLAATAAAFLVGIFSFLYPLRFIPREKLPEILLGLTLAALGIGTIIFCLFLIHRALSRDAEREEKRQR